ncbi:DUF2169 domain-containing protein [Archangium sp.]|uniref:DUF2169 family type VI secretion system accessory protein n=1 Tax=Archangium sp. TaxID=1872627 RepID=UPI002D502CB3|nr:DUF2169 domain-containing protein [Archangium sp.]HYO55840.1 DUF2169 domain-containing protein [Archangium sp.]
MQITVNTTGMLADLAVATDKDARDHCVVVVKGTFLTCPQGELRLAEAQQALVTTDEHYGAPETTSVRYECDFALEKPLTDVIVVGKAVAPKGQRVKKLPVRLEVHGRNKDLMVHGERCWVTVLGKVMASDAVPFTEIPVTFDRAWGGQDDSRGPERVAVEARNLVGVGFHPNRSAAKIAGLPVPNIEPLGRPISSPRERHEPAGFGCIGRAWQPRVAFSGTYDQRWRDERAPFLPGDFDNRYFQCAPLDQQYPHFRGGEKIRCVHMAEQEVVSYIIPTLRIPVRFRFMDGDVERTTVLDTVTLEPHLGRAMLVWRASVPLRKKLTALQEILVGEQFARETSQILGYRNGKPVFAGLAATLAGLRQRRAGKT